MSSGIRTAASILAAGMVASALIILLAAHIVSNRVSRSLSQTGGSVAAGIDNATGRLSNALVAAGRESRSSFSGGSFPSPLQVELKQPRPSLKAEDRERLQKAFIDALTGRTLSDGRTVASVTITTFRTVEGSGRLDVSGMLTCGQPTEEIGFWSLLREDRFGGFGGDVSPRKGNKPLVGNLVIQ